MNDYQIAAPTRRCVVSGRELKPGERYHSVLRDRDGKFVREDYAGDAWTGPPADAFGHWLSRVPTAADANRRPPIDDEMLVECFQRLDGATEPGQVRFRYVVALLLMRRKRFKFEDVDGPTMTLRDVKSNERHAVADPGLSDEQMSAVQDEVFQVLGWA